MDLFQQHVEQLQVNFVLVRASRTSEQQRKRDLSDTQRWAEVIVECKGGEVSGGRRQDGDDHPPCSVILPSTTKPLPLFSLLLCTMFAWCLPEMVPNESGDGGSQGYRGRSVVGESKTGCDDNVHRGRDEEGSITIFVVFRFTKNVVVVLVLLRFTAHPHRLPDPPNLTSNGDVFKKTHDELDFEFLGNIAGKPW
ncbi:hypothetical protein K1719_038245 [Acacia pycnantha]|nr:hypothetical protein K1719_038245 [Acacia pycnantha]